MWQRVYTDMWLLTFKLHLCFHCSCLCGYEILGYLSKFANALNQVCSFCDEVSEKYAKQSFTDALFFQICLVIVGKKYLALVHDGKSPS